MKKILIVTGGGDCPGLNAVIRGVVRAAKVIGGYRVVGSMEAFNGVYADPPDLIKLGRKRTAGIHVKGGTIIRTTNRANPLAYPVQLVDGTWTTEDRTELLADRIRELGFHAVINIGGDGSQKISQALVNHGINVVGVPKTIDNDLSATDLTFGFSTAVQIATDCLDRLVTTAESHHRVIVMEVMGRDAGWIALHTAIAGGSEICLIPEIPYDVNKLIQVINSRYHQGRGFVNIVIAEGVKALNGEVYGTKETLSGDEHIKLGGVSNLLKYQLEQAGCKGQIRTTTLGHIQRGGTPIAFDRILASAMGVKALELIHEGHYGQMIAYKNNALSAVPLTDAIATYNVVNKNHYLVNTARKLGISFGD